MIKSGFTLDDIGSTLSWSALGSFITNLDIDTALARELDKDRAVWGTLSKTNAILADIYDLLNQMNSNMVAQGSGKRAKRAARYLRPDDKKAKHIGTAVPIRNFDNWIEKKRKEDPRNATRSND